MDLPQRNEEGGADLEKDPNLESDLFQIKLRLQGQQAVHSIKWTKFIAGVVYSRLPTPIPMAELRHLVVLDIRAMSLLRIPAAIGSELRLRELNVSFNGLGLGPKTDDQWHWLFGREITKSLQVLNMSQNHLRELPECMWKLKKLTKLNLEGNRLVTLPRKINKTLEYLSVENNDLIHIPVGIFRCPLDFFEFSGNPGLHNDINRHTIQLSSKNEIVQPRSLSDCADRCIFLDKTDYSSLPESLVEQVDGAVRCHCGFQSRNASQFLVLECLMYWDLSPKYKRRFPGNHQQRNKVNVECAVCSADCQDTLYWHLNTKYRPIWYQHDTSREVHSLL